jgi:hypothetical protein
MFNFFARLDVVSFTLLIFAAMLLNMFALQCRGLGVFDSVLLYYRVQRF